MKNKLKKLREKRGLSQAEVAQEIGISRQMYNKYERGDTEPSLNSIRSLCTLYSVPYEELLGSIENHKQNDPYKIDSPIGEISVGSPSTAYGTENYYTQILNLLPHLLLSEKSRLLAAVAQSMTEEVEYETKKRRSQLPKVNWNDVHFPSEGEYNRNIEEFLQYSQSHSFDSHGQKWSREEMHER